MRVLAALALLVMAAAHLALWLRGFDPARHSYDPRDSWLFRHAGVDERGFRRTAVVVAVLVAGIFVLAAAGLAARASWASEAAAGGAALSMLLAVVFFHPWLSVLLVVDLAVLTLAL